MTTEQQYLDNRRGLTIFTFMWALSIVFHYSKAESITTAITTPIQLMVGLTACYMMVYPWRTVGLGLLVTLQLGEFLTMTPYVANHWTLTTAISSTLFITLLLQRARRGTIDRGEVFATFAPIARMCLLVLYFFATFHKLNADFFDTSLSCSAFLYQRLSVSLPLPTSAPFPQLSIYATLLAEAGIPLLLVFRRTRWIGIAVGVIFHGTLAFDHFYDFTALLFALFFLFTAPGSYSAFYTRHQRFLLMFNRRHLRSLLLVLLCSFSGIMAFRGGLGLGTGTSNIGLVVAWAMYLFTLLVTWVPVVLPVLWLPNPGFLRIMRPVYPSLIVIPLVLILNGISPYLGLRTGTSFDMWSNLQTSAPDNHLIMPASLNLLGDATTPVTILDSDDELLNAYIEQDLLITRWELQRQIHDKPLLNVTYARLNATSAVTVLIANNRDEMLQGYSPLLAKFVTFKPLDADGHGICP